jgi:exonuclease SbcD
VTIGIEYAVSPSRLPATASYVALGHVHRPQPVRGAPSPTRYAGSLLQLDFGERDQRKSVAVVEAVPGRPARVTEVPLSSGRPLVDVEGTLEEAVARGRAHPEAHLRVTVRTDGPVPGLAERVREELPNAVDVRLHRQRVDGPGDGRDRPGPSPSPRDQFAAYYRREHGVEEVPAELLRAFDEVLEAVEEGAGGGGR